MSSPHFSVATAIEKDRIASDVAFVLVIEIDVLNSSGTLVETLYLAKNSENLVYQGNSYIASNFSVKIDLDAASDPKLQIQAEDPSGVIRDRLELYSGGIGFPVRVKVVNTGNISQPPEVSESFKVTQASQNGYSVSFTMGIDNPVSLRFPNRLAYREQCTYQYKGPRCQYAGAITNCDYTYSGTNGCKAHSNQANYGGFLGLQNFG